MEHWAAATRSVTKERIYKSVSLQALRQRVNCSYSYVLQGIGM